MLFKKLIKKHYFFLQTTKILFLKNKSKGKSKIIKHILYNFLKEKLCLKSFILFLTEDSVANGSNIFFTINSKLLFFKNKLRLFLLNIFACLGEWYPLQYFPKIFIELLEPSGVKIIKVALEAFLELNNFFISSILSICSIKLFKII